MKKYISARYINEKIMPIEHLQTILADTDEDDISEQISDFWAKEIAFSFAVIAKELGVKIPDV